MRRKKWLPAAGISMAGSAPRAVRAAGFPGATPVPWTTTSRVSPGGDKGRWWESQNFLARARETCRAGGGVSRPGHAQALRAVERRSLAAIRGRWVRATCRAGGGVSRPGHAQALGRKESRYSVGVPFLHAMFLSAEYLEAAAFLVCISHTVLLIR